MKKAAYVVGAAFAGLSIGMGAFGVHGLETRVDERALHWWKTGAQYQMYHGVALLILGILMARYPERPMLKAVGYLFVIGTLVFSGTLYAMTIGAVVGKDFRMLGAVTPLGGAMLIIGWGLLAIAMLRNGTEEARRKR